MKIYLTLPILNEFEYLQTLIEALKKQTYKNFELIAVVNQPNDWWNNPEKIAICENNQKTLEYLKSIKDFELEIIDKSSQGQGWDKKRFGVGWARKVAMDRAGKKAKDDDLILSIDADVFVYPNYLITINDFFKKNKKAQVLQVPYFHELTGDEKKDRAILRYEIYMRYYAINLWKIKSPYNFTAVGSGMAVKSKIYKKIGGITPKVSGEDFYFIQKLRKFCPVYSYVKESVYPLARYSDRVFFGTGPAMIKGKEGEWESYPIYNYKDFLKIKETYLLIEKLFKEDIATPMTSFLESQFNTSNVFEPLRKNSKDLKRFCKAFHEKVDALRILQFLKDLNRNSDSSDEENFRDFFNENYTACEKKPLENIINDPKFNFETMSIENLDIIRHFLYENEKEYQYLHNGTCYLDYYLS